jgi:AcrR family transcriptional regulator
LTQSTIGAFDRSALATAKRQTILSCASRLFNQKGIDATSVDEIAAQIGVTKKTIYRLIGNKQELVMACSSRGFTIFNYIRDSMLLFDGTRLDALAFAHHAIAECVLNAELSPMLYVIGLGSLTRAQRQDIQLSGLLLSAGYQATIVAGVKEGSIRETDIECHGLMLPGLFVWLASENNNTSQSQREKIAAEIASIVAIGLAVK